MSFPIFSAFNPMFFSLGILAFLALVGVTFLFLRLLDRSSLTAKLKAPMGLFIFSVLLRAFLQRSTLTLDSAFSLILQIFILLAGAYLGVKILEIITVDLLLASWKGVKPPAILGNVLSFFLYLLSLGFILHYILRVNLTPILATSAVLTMVVGLALQDILGNLFSGLALHMEKSLEVGDWVSIRDQSGRIVEMNWRSIKLQTREDSIIIIPNGTISKEAVINYSHARIPQSWVVKVGLPYQTPPFKAQEIMLKTTQEIPDILGEPAPRIRPVQYGQFSIEYEIRFWISDFSQALRIEGEFLRLLWYRLDREEVYVPFPTQHLYLHPYSARAQADQRSRIAGEILQTLSRIEIFSPLTPPELQRVASRVRVQRYCSGEIVLRQGDPGDSFFVIKEGEVEVSLGDPLGDRQVLTHLGKGNIVGEMALLTGEARSANIIALSDCEFLVLGKEGFQDIITANPMIAHALSEILARRRLELDREMAKGKRKEKVMEESCQSILMRIRAFFGLA